MTSITGTWTKLASHEKLQRSSHSIGAVGPNVYVFGGELKARQPRDNELHKLRIIAAEKPTANVESTQAHNSPSSRVGSASTACNGKIYLFSGRGGEAMAPIDEEGCLWELDTGTDSWTSISPSTRSSSPYPEPRSYHAMTSDSEKTIYIHAGCPERGRLSDLWSFNLSTNQWKQLASAPDPSRGGTSIASANGKLHRMNGFDGKAEQGGALDVYDPASDTWSTRNYNPDGRAGPGARSVAALLPVNINGKQHLVTSFGESDPSSLGHQGAGKMLGDIWAYSLDAANWIRINAGEPPAPRGWFGADVVTLEGQQGIVVVGGLANSNERLDDVWLLSFDA